jgi:hypothetical protein
MLRVRDKSGKATEIEGGVAVEFVSGDGRLGAVILQKHDGTIEIATPGDHAFNAYAHVNRLRSAKVYKHEPFAGKPVTV